MDEITKKIKELNEIDFPPGLHGKIMRKLAFLQFRTPFLIVVSLLLLNLVFSGWKIWSNLSGSEAVSTFKVLMETFDWTWRSAIEIFNASQELFPMGLIVSFSINIMLAVYLLYIMKEFKNLAIKK